MSSFHSNSHTSSERCRRRYWKQRYEKAVFVNPTFFCVSVFWNKSLCCCESRGYCILNAARSLLFKASPCKELNMLLRFLMFFVSSWHRSSWFYFFPFGFCVVCVSLTLAFFPLSLWSVKHRRAVVEQSWWVKCKEAKTHHTLKASYWPYYLFLWSSVLLVV